MFALHSSWLFVFPIFQPFQPAATKVEQEIWELCFRSINDPVDLGLPGGGGPWAHWACLGMCFSSDVLYEFWWYHLLFLLGCIVSGFMRFYVFFFLFENQKWCWIWTVLQIRCVLCESSLRIFFQNKTIQICSNHRFLCIHSLCVRRLHSLESRVQIVPSVEYNPIEPYKASIRCWLTFVSQLRPFLFRITVSILCYSHSWPL